MKVLLIGYPGSQKVLKASKFLIDKYVPSHFDISYHEYGGEIEGWANYVSSFFYTTTDNHVIFSLDDYLMAGPVDMAKYKLAEREICDNENIVCSKLCKSTDQEHEEYPITTQWCIWDREFLIWLLSQVKTPWQFEVEGSKIFKNHEKHFQRKSVLRTCMDYYANSSISSKWVGINMEGLSLEDIKILTTRGYIF